MTETLQNNYEYKPNQYILLNEEFHKYQTMVGEMSHNPNDLLIMKFQKQIEILKVSFEYEGDIYMFILETHFTLDRKQLFKTIKIIVKNSLSITSKIFHKDFKIPCYIILKRSDFPTDHHYNPRFLAKAWKISDKEPTDCNTFILKKFLNKEKTFRDHKKNKMNVKSIFSKDHLYSKIENNSLSTLEKGFIWESELLLQDLLKKYETSNSKMEIIEKYSEDYITILSLFLRIQFKSDKIAVDNFFHILDSVCNEYSTFQKFCLTHVCLSSERELIKVFNKNFHVAIFETENPIGFFLSEQWKIFGTNQTSTEIDALVIPLTPKKAIIFSHDLEYIKNFDNKFENFQKMYLLNLLHEILNSEKPLSLIYKNDENRSAENFIEKILKEPYFEYLDLPEEYKKVSVIDIWKNDKYDINVVLNAISKSNKNIKYFQD